MLWWATKKKFLPIITYPSFLSDIVDIVCYLSEIYVCYILCNYVVSTQFYLVTLKNYSIYKMSFNNGQNANILNLHEKCNDEMKNIHLISRNILMMCVI